MVIAIFVVIAVIGLAGAAYFRKKKAAAAAIVVKVPAPVSSGPVAVVPGQREATLQEITAKKL